MNLTPQMLKEFKDIIFEKSELQESVKEPIHIICVNMMAMEYAYKDFMSRETVGVHDRAEPVRVLINMHGGNTFNFDAWFTSYEEGKGAWET